MPAVLSTFFISCLTATTGFELEELFGSHVDEFADYGYAMAMYENTAVIGAPGDGEVYVYELNEDTNIWEEIQIIEDIFDDENDYFGQYLAMYNNSMVIVSDYDKPLYFYERINGSNQWTEVSHVNQVGGVYSIAMSNNYVVVGDGNCHDFGDFSGCMHVYKKNKLFNGTQTVFNWTFLETVYSSDASAYDHFGEDVDIWDDEWIITSSVDNKIYGTVYFFEIIESDDGIVNITERDILQPNDTDFREFGTNVAIQDNTAVISSSSPCCGPDHLYIFERNETTGEWEKVNRFSVFETSRLALDIYNNYIIAGYSVFRGVDGARIFHRNHPNETWGQIAEINATNGTDPGADFGQTVAISKDFAFIGAPDHDKKNQSRTGGVFIVSDFKPNYLSNPPTTQPSLQPTTQPSLAPTAQPTVFPSNFPTISPTDLPTVIPSLLPTAEPTANGALTEDDDEDNNTNNESSEDNAPPSVETTPSPTFLSAKSDDDTGIQVILIGLTVLFAVTNIGTCIYCKRKRDEDYDNGYQDACEDNGIDNNNNNIDYYEDDNKNNDFGSAGSRPLSHQGSVTLGLEMGNQIIEEEAIGNTTDQYPPYGTDIFGNGNYYNYNGIYGTDGTTNIMNMNINDIPRQPSVKLEIDGMPVTGGGYTDNTNNYQYNTNVNNNYGDDDESSESYYDGNNTAGNNLMTAGNNEIIVGKNTNGGVNEQYPVDTNYQDKNGEDDEQVIDNMNNTGRNQAQTVVVKDDIDNNNEYNDDVEHNLDDYVGHPDDNNNNDNDNDNENIGEQDDNKPDDNIEMSGEDSDESVVDDGANTTGGFKQ